KALGTSTIPETVTVDGFEVPTDVLQRKFEPAFRLVTEAVAPQRKTRQDPIVPGISVGHPTTTAGTIGCVVYDRDDGTPYVLSNWHVLHTAAGALGDVVVQPGPRDDNRIDRNRLGKLVRSHLGTAGDCAVAAIEDRRFSAEITGLDVVPDRLGEPELGDKVIKSGRTTAVTHGIVRRVDVIARIDYRGVGPKSIGASRSDRIQPIPRPTARSAAGATPGRRGCSNRPTAGPAPYWPDCISRARRAPTPTSTRWPACRNRCSRSSASA
ncbi:hypothetical protein ABZ529_33980, partial [Nocardia sp. NPDC019302]